MKRFVFSIDLKDDPEVIEKYISLHRSVPKDIIENLPETSIRSMEIYSIGNRLVNIVEDDDDYDPYENTRDKAHPSVMAWEELMSTMQVPLKEATRGKKWTLMNSIYKR